MGKVMKRTAWGILMGCTIFTFVGILLCLINGTATVFGDTAYGFITMAVCSMIVGLGFSLPTLIYDYPKLTEAMQTLIHLAIGFVIFGIVAFYAKWIPIEGGIGTIFLFIMIALLSTVVIWLAFYLYYKNEAKRINESIRKKQNKK